MGYLVNTRTINNIIIYKVLLICDIMFSMLNQSPVYKYWWVTGRILEIDHSNDTVKSKQTGGLVSVITMKVPTGGSVGGGC